MKRRTLLQRVGTAAVGTAVLGGTAAASTDSDISIDRKLDVSSLSGDVTFETLLDEDDLEQLPDDVDPSKEGVIIAEEAEVIELADCCYLCDYQTCACLCCRFYDCPPL